MELGLWAQESASPERPKTTFSLLAVFPLKQIKKKKKKTHDESIKQREIFVPPFEVVQGVRLRQMQDAKNSNATVSFSIKQVMVRYYQVVHHAYPIQISQEWKVVPPPLSHPCPNLQSFHTIISQSQQIRLFVSAYHPPDEMLLFVLAAVFSSIGLFFHAYIRQP